MVAANWRSHESLRPGVLCVFGCLRANRKAHGNARDVFWEFSNLSGEGRGPRGGFSDGLTSFFFGSEVFGVSWRSRRFS